MKQVCWNLPFVTPVSGVKQSANVHGPCLQLWELRLVSNLLQPIVHHFVQQLYSGRLTITIWNILVYFRIRQLQFVTPPAAGSSSLSLQEIRQILQLQFQLLWNRASVLQVDRQAGKIWVLYNLCFIFSSFVDLALALLKQISFATEICFTYSLSKVLIAFSVRPSFTILFTRKVNKIHKIVGRLNPSIFCFIFFIKSRRIH